MSKLELVRRALAELGEATSEELAAFIEGRHGVRIDPRYVPVLRASLLELEMLARARQAAKAGEVDGAKAGNDLGTGPSGQESPGTPVPAGEVPGKGPG